MQQATITPIHLQESQVTHGHGTGIEAEACNDETFQEEKTRLTMLLSVLVNMLGGAVLLSVMFVLPHLIGFLLN